MGQPEVLWFRHAKVDLLFLTSPASAAKAYLRYLLLRRFNVLKLHVTAS